jgi:hypothetical protein
VAQVRVRLCLLATGYNEIDHKAWSICSLPTAALGLFQQEMWSAEELH